MLEDWLRDFMYVSMRWLHIVCTTLVVGGTLFFEFVVPIAVEDLKTEQQLSVAGKARWVFRRVIWPCAFLLLATGAISLLRSWDTYAIADRRELLISAVAHVVLGVASLGIALSLTIPRSPPDAPVWWMKVNLAVLLFCILAATITRHVRLEIGDRATAAVRNDQNFQRLSPATSPATRPR